MIRKFHETDIEQVMDIWLASNVEAHSFVPEKYWRSNFDMVKEQLPQADVYVFDCDGKIQGFIGISDGYIAGIFVDKKYRSHGIGKQLLCHAKQTYSALTLSVYRKNDRAAAFYLREGFSILSEQPDEATGEPEYTMGWRKSNHVLVEHK